MIRAIISLTNGTYNSMFRQLNSHSFLAYSICRLVKPDLSQMNSYEDLQLQIKANQLKDLEQYNRRQFNHNKQYTPQVMISDILNVSMQLAQEISERKISFSTVSPKSLKHYTLKKPLNAEKINYPLLFEEIQSNIPETENAPMHFSHVRGKPVIEKYEFNDKNAFLFNLPEDINNDQIHDALKEFKIESVKINQCILGLPSYAEITFFEKQAKTMQQMIQIYKKTHIQIGDRLCFLKTKKNQKHISIHNRRIVIQGLAAKQPNLLLRLSQFGRVTHLDFPTFISRNCSIDQVKQQYKNSKNLVKINIHKPNGQVFSEYYPSLKEVQELQGNNKEHTQAFDNKITQKLQSINTRYNHRMRFAQEVDVYEGQQNTVNHKGMGYCIVTYSCTEQAQNCYFNLRHYYKMQLFGQQNEQFHFDEQYRQKILRIIDCDQRSGFAERQQLKEQKLREQAQQEQQRGGKHLFQKLVGLQLAEKLIKKYKVVNNKVKNLNFDDDDYKKQVYQQQNAFISNKQHEITLKKVKIVLDNIKSSISMLLGGGPRGKTFEEMAEEQLFGRVLPKKKDKDTRLNVSDLPEMSQLEKQVKNFNVMNNLSSQSVIDRQEEYQKKMMETNPTQSQQLFGDIITDDTEIQQQQQQQQYHQGLDDDIEPPDQQQIQQYSGKQGFSTTKNRSVAFKKRDSLEEAQYIIRYCEYVRTIINEYMGVFPQGRLKNRVSRPTYLNLRELTLNDNTPFLTQQFLPDALECMRNVQKAQELYSQYFIQNEHIKTRSIDIREFFDTSNSAKISSTRIYNDRGLIKEVYQVDQQQDIEKKVKYLNNSVADFGEQFKIQLDENNKKVIAKIIKIGHIYPLDRIAIIQEYKRKHMNQQKEKFKFTAQQINLFNQNISQILETGEIPQVMRQAFKLKPEVTLDDLFEELSSEAGITKKDVEMMLNLNNYTDEQIGSDIAMQEEMQKDRIREDQSKASNFAKDPSNIQVQDRQGFFKVSKFRQI